MVISYTQPKHVGVKGNIRFCVLGWLCCLYLKKFQKCITNNYFTRTPEIFKTFCRREQAWQFLVQMWRVKKVIDQYCQYCTVMTEGGHTFSTKLLAVSCLVISVNICFSCCSSTLARSTFSFLIPVMSLDIFSSAIRSSFCSRNGWSTTEYWRYNSRVTLITYFVLSVWFTCQYSDHSILHKMAAYLWTSDCKWRGTKLTPEHSKGTQTNWGNHQTVTSITFSFCQLSYIKYTWMPSPNYKYINSWLRVFQSGNIQVYLWILCYVNIVLLTNLISDVAKFSPAKPKSLLVSCKLSFMTDGFKMYSLSHFKSEHPTQFFYNVFTEFIEYLLWFLTDTLLCIITFIPSWSMCIQNTNITPASS